MNFEPIGTFHCDARRPYDAPRQPALATASTGHVQLHPGRNFEQALQDLAGFSRIWLLYAFHHNAGWKPLVQPPRADRKVGVFASRAPYRPNPIGLSCVILHAVCGLRIEVGPHDLLDGTPILDIKPYVPYADAFPEAATGWLDELDATRWDLHYTPDAEAQIAWLLERGVHLRPFLEQQLAENPLDQRRKRVRPLETPHTWEIAYRTWRAAFIADSANAQITIQHLYTGYSPADLALAGDPHADKYLHRAFQAEFPA